MAWTWDLEASSSWPCSSSWGTSGCVPWWRPRNLVSDHPYVTPCSSASLTGQQSIQAREPGETPNAMGVCKSLALGGSLFLFVSLKATGWYDGLTGEQK